MTGIIGWRGIISASGAIVKSPTNQGVYLEPCHCMDFTQVQKNLTKMPKKEENLYKISYRGFPLFLGEVWQTPQSLTVYRLIKHTLVGSDLTIALLADIMRRQSMTGFIDKRRAGVDLSICQ